MINNPLVSNQGTVTKKTQVKEPEPFEKDPLDKVKSIQLRNINNKFQNLMKADIAKVKASLNLFIVADKTTKIQKLSATDYKKLLKGNITNSYEKLTPSLEDAINLEAK